MTNTVILEKTYIQVEINHMSEKQAFDLFERGIITAQQMQAKWDYDNDNGEDFADATLAEVAKLEELAELGELCDE